MTQAGRPRPVRRMIQSFVGLMLFVASLTALWLSMRAVMDLGGSCGPGPGVPECPDSVAWPMMLAFPVGFAALVVYLVGSENLPGPRLVALAWPALFLSLGFNFWEYGLAPPGLSGPEWGMLVCAVVFTLMGGLPLLALADRDVARRMFWADAPAAGSDRQRPTVRAAAPRLRSAARLGVGSGDAVRPDQVIDEQARDALDVAAQLQRLAERHRAGGLTDDEFAAAKDRILGGAG